MFGGCRMYCMIQMQKAAYLRMTTVVTDSYNIISCFKKISRRFFIKRGKILFFKRNRNFFLFTRLQCFCLLETSQSLIRLRQFSGRNADINLDYFLTREFTGIGHICFDCNCRSFSTDFSAFCFKFCVRKTIPEREERFFACGVIVTVADKDAFLVLRIISFTEIADRYDILRFHPGSGQLAGRTAFTGKNIAKDVTDRCTKLGKQQNIRNIHNRGKIHRAAGIENKHKLLIFFCTKMNITDFRIC